MVDNRREGESEQLELSNFCILEDRESLDIEIYTTRIGADPKRVWRAGVHKYVFSPP